jgi:hypothetical protein
LWRRVHYHIRCKIILYGELIRICWLKGKETIQNILEYDIHSGIPPHPYWITNSSLGYLVPSSFRNKCYARRKYSGGSLGTFVGMSLVIMDPAVYSESLLSFIAEIGSINILLVYEVRVGDYSGVSQRTTCFLAGNNYMGKTWLDVLKSLKPMLICRAE